jgi:hypothetical protein
MAKPDPQNTPSADDPLALPGPQRYAWFVAEVSRGGNIWMAESPEHAMMRRAEDGTRLVPIWPGAEIARSCFSPEDIAEGYAPVARSIDDWLERSTPALVKAGVRLAVCPNRRGSAPVVPPPHLLNDLLLVRERAARRSGTDSAGQTESLADSLALGLSADSQAALERFVARVREGRTVWLLRGKDGIRVSGSNEDGDDDGIDTTVFPVWSDRAYARRCAAGEWRDSEPFPVTIEDFMQAWLPGMDGNGERVGPNWNADLVGKEVMPLELLEMLAGP